jgi:hypothetical protein
MTVLRVAYADPPYIGQSTKHYADHADFAGEVDHGELLDRLIADYPDGWALSLHMPSLGIILALLAERGLSLYDGDFRVMPWLKSFGAFKRNVRVAYVWEPVIVKTPLRLPGAVPTRDFLVESISMRRGFSGAKPERFCYWLFNVLGLRPGDELHDLFPGSGAVMLAWEKWCAEGGPKLKQSVRVVSELEVLDAA